MFIQNLLWIVIYNKYSGSNKSDSNLKDNMIWNIKTTVHKYIYLGLRGLMVQTG